MQTNIWEKYTDEKEKQVHNFCNGYKNFISNCKTERECVEYIKKEAEKNGFKNLETLIQKKSKLKAGDKVYSVNMDKNIILFIVGEEPIEKGINIIGSHVDSPRLDLKATPIYESQGFCMMDTHYYGGIKKYQWLSFPLAIHGVIVKKDGKQIKFVFGEDDGPVVGISDLLPHLDRAEKREIKGEDLNLIVGNKANPKSKNDKFKSLILDILKSHNIDENDLFSAEIEIVPSGKARDFGLDNSMIIGYGQDDRVCAYTSLQAILETKNPKTSTLCMMVDKEEIGSVGATGMQSQTFENTLAEIMNLCSQYNELSLRRALNKSNMLSSDVTAAVDPNYLDPFNIPTDAQFAKGISFNKYTGSGGKYDANDANPEYIAKLRNCLDKANVSYQATEMGKIDQGGGGTIAFIMAKYGMNVIDAGVAVLGMHSPWEIVSKVDVYETYKAYKAFFKM